MIPKVIHKVYISHDMKLPDNLSPSLGIAHESWKTLNPDYKLKYWSHADCLEFLKTEFDDDIYYETFIALQPYSYKCDFFRFCLIYKRGGFYSDWKQRCIIPLDDIEKNNTLEWISCLDMGNGYARYYKCMGTGFFGSRPNHPVLKSAIEQIIENVKLKFYGNSCLDPTGPFLFGNAFKKNKNEMKNFVLGNFDWDNYFTFGNNNIKAVQHKCDGVSTDQNWEEGNNYVTMWVERRVYA